MATLNTDIYTKAISQFEDPFITNAYNNNPILFYKIMYNYLINAIPLCNTPNSIVTILADKTESSGNIELFNGDNATVAFTLSTTPTPGAYFLYMVDDAYIDGTYNSITNSVTLDFAPVTGTENVSIEWYEPGYFNNTIDIQVQNFIACFLVACWGEREKNFLLDIRRLLNDSQFKLDSAAPNIQAKNNWFYSMREKAEKLMNQYAWQVYQSAIKARYGLS